ncbi:MAG: zinc ribbon domain-containing protein [Thermoanaerobaculia bacterium]|nr:zinc ribbon domain-containing protein [Thermoanaerobaculia bacterium]
MFCNQCGKPVTPEARFCGSCGTGLSHQRIPAQAPPQTPLQASLQAVPLGGRVPIPKEITASLRNPNSLTGLPKSPVVALLLQLLLPGLGMVYFGKPLSGLGNLVGVGCGWFAFGTYGGIFMYLLFAIAAYAIVYRENAAVAAIHQAMATAGWRVDGDGIVRTG